MDQFDNHDYPFALQGRLTHYFIFTRYFGLPSTFIYFVDSQAAILKLRRNYFLAILYHRDIGSCIYLPLFINLGDQYSQGIYHGSSVRSNTRNLYNITYLTLLITFYLFRLIYYFLDLFCSNCQNPHLAYDDIKLNVQL